LIGKPRRKTFIGGKKEGSRGKHADKKGGGQPQRSKKKEGEGIM